MPFGLRVFDAGGATRLEISDRLSRIIYSSTAQSGSAYVPAFDTSLGVFGFVASTGSVRNATCSFDAATKIFTWNSPNPGLAYCLLFK